jgi:hypothetical protein
LERKIDRLSLAPGRTTLACEMHDRLANGECNQRLASR